MSSGLESYNAAAAAPSFGVNKVDVFSSPGVGGRISVRAIAIAVAAVLVVGGGYFAVTKVQQAYEASGKPVADSSVPLAVREQAVFIKKVDKICAASFAKVKALPIPTTVPEFGPWASQVLGVYKGAYADIAALKTPKRDRKLFNKFLAGFRSEISLVEDGVIPAVASGNVAGAQTLMAKGTKLSQKNAGLALQYGLVECGAPR